MYMKFLKSKTIFLNMIREKKNNFNMKIRKTFRLDRKDEIQKCHQNGLKTNLYKRVNQEESLK